MPNKTKIISIAVAGLIIIGGGAAYYMEKPASVSAAETVRMTSVQRGDVSLTVSTTGTLGPLNQVSFSSPANGVKITDIKVKVGDKVTAGQALATFDNASAQIQLESAKASLASAQTKLAQAKQGPSKAQIAVQSANVEKAQANLNDAIANYNDTANAANATTSKKDQAQASMDQAQASYDSAVEQLNSLKAGPDSASLLSAQAAVDQAQSQVTQAQQTLDAYAIKAPFDAVVSVVNGQVGAALANNTSLITLDDTRSATLTAVLQVSQTDITKIQSGMAADVTTTALQGQTFNGTVTTVAPDSTTSNGLTTYAVGLNVDNPDGLLHSGMNVNVTITVGTHKNVLTIPSMALKQMGSRVGVYVKDSSAGSSAAQTSPAPSKNPSDSGGSASAGSGRGRQYGSAGNSGGYGGGASGRQGNASSSASGASQNTSLSGLKFVPIETGYITGSKVEVVSGLTEGEQIAIVTPAPAQTSSQRSGNGSGGSSLFGGGGMGGFGGGYSGGGYTRGGGNRGGGGGRGGN